MKSSLKFRHKANNNNKLVNLNYRNYHKTINANKTIVSRQLRSSSHKANVMETWKLISMYIALIIILGLLALLTQQGGYYFNILLAKSSPTISDIVPVTLNNFGSKEKQQRSSGQNIDDSWKLGLYTNRTLGRDYDPLLIVYDTTLKTSVNYSSRLLKETIATSRNIVSTTVMSNNEDLMFHSCTGTTLRHYCRIKSSQLLQDLTFMAHMSMFNNLGLQVSKQQMFANNQASTISPQLQNLIALAVYGDTDFNSGLFVDDSDFWESLNLLNVVLTDIYNYVPDKNR